MIVINKECERAGELRALDLQLDVASLEECRWCDIPCEKLLLGIFGHCEFSPRCLPTRS